MRQEYAETIALNALGWLIGNEDLLPVFMGSTGVSEDDLRQRAGEADFLASVLDFLMMDDAWLTQFCDGAQIPYEDLARARAALPGADHIHWT